MASFHQLPQVADPHPAEPSFARAMLRLTEGFLLVWPRAIIIGFWVFSDLLGDAYDGWVVPVLGFVLAPWTTMTYAIMWGISSDGVGGAEWVAVGVAALADLVTLLIARAVR